MVVWKSGGCGGEAAKRAAKQEKRLGMTRGRERRRLEGNKSPVIRVRPRHRPVDPVTQSTYWPRLGAPDGGRSTWAQVQLYSGLPSGARAAGQGVGGSDLDLAHVPVSRYPSWSRYMAHHCDYLTCKPPLPKCLSSKLPVCDAAPESESHQAVGTAASSLLSCRS